MQPKAAVSPIIKYVRSIEGNYMTLAEVARALNVVEETLRLWRKRDPERFGPSLMTHFGDVPVYLYSLDDLERVRRNAKERGIAKCGRPRLWTVREGQARQRRMTRVSYLRARAKVLRAEGESARAGEMERKARDMNRALQSESKARRKALGR